MLDAGFCAASYSRLDNLRMDSSPPYDKWPCRPRGIKGSALLVRLPICSVIYSSNGGDNVACFGGRILVS